jgi:hypothetical protein
MAFYNPKILYDRDTMPKVEGWEETNNCDFVCFHWVLTEADQKEVDAHWRPVFYRHSLINTKMALAASAGAGIPGWEDLGTKIAQGKPIYPTGLEDDPRLPERESDGPRGDIMGMLCDAAARANEENAVEHAQMLANFKKRKSSSWAQRAMAASEDEPTLMDVAQLRAARFSPAPRDWSYAGTWRPWEIEEILMERARQDGVEAAWQRAEARVKSVLGQKWGGGT